MSGTGQHHPVDRGSDQTGTPIDKRVRDDHRVSKLHFSKVRLAYPDDKQLREASEADFRNLGVSVNQAKEIRRLIHRSEEKHATLWDKQRKRKISGRAAPKLTNLEAYLSEPKNERYEVYSNQDLCKDPAPACFDLQGSPAEAAAAEDPAAAEENDDAEGNLQFHDEIAQVKTEFADCIDVLLDWLQALRDDDGLKERELFGAHQKLIYDEAKSLRDELRSETGHEAVILGTNGLGKSTLINFMLLLSSTDPISYTKSIKKSGFTLESLEAYSHIDSSSRVKVEQAPAFTPEQAELALKRRCDDIKKLQKFSRGESMDDKQAIQIPEV